MGKKLYGKRKIIYTAEKNMVEFFTGILIINFGLIGYIFIKDILQERRDGMSKNN